MRLQNTVALYADETVASFASRLAAANGIPSITELLMDAEHSMAGFLNGDQKTFNTLAALGGVTLDDLTQHAFIPTGISTYRCMGHELGMRNLLRGRSRICPACFREDKGPELTPDTALGAYGRILWSLASARVCPIHRLSLISAPENTVQHEFSDTWSLWLPEIGEGSLDQLVAEGGLYEEHVARRLAGDILDGWASRFPIDALGATCEMLGISQIYGKYAILGGISGAELAVATSVGFRFLDSGPTEITAYFETLRRALGQPQDRPQARYGRIYDWLKRGAGSGPELEPLRAILRQHILENWPFGGRRSGARLRSYIRRLHSIRTAAKTHNLHPKRLRHILTDSGIITEADLPDFEVLFSAVEAQEILEQASGAVTFSAAQKRLGMTRSQMETLIRAGILKPGEGGEKARPRFTEATIQHWLAFFTSFRSSPKWDSLISIVDAARKYGSSTDRVKGLILDHSLTKVYSVKGVIGFSAVVIDKAEVARLLVKS
ncbi:TniQ family protein [Sulfitobacter sp.]|uniref:TniQ family protein n=1 Tax=Sulfitobacter sp. TaxID=1903071 RepID=UPI0030015E0F